MRIIIPILHTDLFTWSRWRGFDILYYLKIPCRKSILIGNKEILKKYVVGYIEGYKLICRPKSEHFAVMFFYNDHHQWCHFNKIEFEAIFCE